MPSAPRLDQQLCFALYRASRAVIRAYGPLLEPLGLTYPQYLVMLVLWEGEGISVKQLGERLALDSATLTPLLKRLEQQALVERSRDPDDERVVRVGLSRAGRALEKKAHEIPARLACQFIDVDDDAELKKIGKLRGALHALADKLEPS
ncbi:MAG: MarR family transcriptional regulator [Myxococcales bacterium]|nr:MarR family transcriptional regulator [Myxococcales bacterium]